MTGQSTDNPCGLVRVLRELHLEAFHSKVPHTYITFPTNATTQCSLNPFHHDVATVDSWLMRKLEQSNHAPTVKVLHFTLSKRDSSQKRCSFEIYEDSGNRPERSLEQQTNCHLVGF